MSAYLALSEGIVDLFDADTGTGGFAHATTPLVTGYFNTYAPNETAFPFVVFSHVSGVDESGFDNDVASVRVQFSAFTDRRGGLSSMKTIGERLRTVFRRVAPTVSGWTASPGEFYEVGMYDEGETFHSIHECEYVLTGS